MLRKIVSKQFIFLLVLAVGIYLLAFPYRSLAMNWFGPGIDRVKTIITPQTLKSTETQIKTLAERGSTIASESGNFLDNVVGVNQSEATKSTLEKGIDYAQYRYCKQVVEDWESKATKK